MSTMSGGPNIVTNGLVLYVDDSNTQSFVSGGSTWFDLTSNNNNATISGGESTFGSSMSWSNNIETITINIVLKKIGINTYYAIHPINKWNNSYLNNASFILYNFGTYNGANPNDDGNLGFYGNTTAENGTGWQGLTAIYKMVLNETVCVGFTYNYLSGGQMFINGVKYGGVYGGGRLGQTSINSSVSNLIIQGPNNYESQKVYHCSIYNRVLSDDEMRQNYNSTKSRFGLP